VILKREKGRAFSPHDVFLLPQVAERERASKAARGTPAEQQALDKARALGAEIAAQRDQDAKLGRMMLDQQSLEEVGSWINAWHG
jgi:hypothetical protein